MQRQINKTIFDRTEWENRISFYNNITSVINDTSAIQQHFESTQKSLEYIIHKDPRLLYYDYRFRNPMKDGYYRRRLNQFLSDSDSDDDQDDTPNKYLFSIEHEFINDMKRRFCESEGYCWNYINIGCRKYPCEKKHVFYHPTREQITNYFDIFVSN
jgi:hypothetical protein